MAFNPTYLTGGSGVGPLLTMHKDDLILVPLSITFGGSDTYLTGGMTLTLPDEFSERTLVDVILTKDFDGTRVWRWDGTQGLTGKLLAYDAFATEEGNATSIASVVLRAILILK